MNLLTEEDVKGHLDSVLSQRDDADLGSPRRVPLRELRLEDVIGTGSFEDSAYGDVLRLALDDSFVRFVPRGWDRTRSSEGGEPHPAAEVPLFVRRLAFERGSLLVLDEPSPARNLIASIAPGPWLTVSPLYRGPSVISLGFIRGAISTVSLIVTHCDTTDGCAGAQPGCSCRDVEVTTAEGDDAWACLCGNHKDSP